jgi:drug/metabolite transporter (DMT)-like permease
MGIFGKLAFDDGVTVGTLLAVRFSVAAGVFWLIVLGTGARSLRAVGRRDLGLALALGAVGYGAQAGAYFAALERVDASLLALLVYTFPTIVTVAAILLGREAASRRTGAALVLASTGLVLVLAGAAGALDPVGAALGMAAAVVYSAYILTSQGVAARVGSLALSTLVCTGAAASLTLAGLVRGDIDLGGATAAGLGWVAAIALVSTVAAITLFFAGLRRVGPTSASILSTLEPVVTVALAFVVFGESLGPAQLVGGTLVLLAVLVVRARARASAVRPSRIPALEQEAA